MANRVVMKQKMKDNPFITDLLDERKVLLMTHDTPSPHASAPGTPLGAQLEHWLLTIPTASASAPGRAAVPAAWLAEPVGGVEADCLLRGGLPAGAAAVGPGR